MRSSLLGKVVIFATGAAIGSAATYFLMKRKYEEVEYEEYYDDDESEEGADGIPEEKEEPIKTKSPKQETMTRYNKIINDSGYTGSEKEEDEEVDEPYAITAEEFAELEDYETVTLYYYADDVLTDELGNVIDDPEDTVGTDTLDAFNESYLDSIYVRNDARKTDYEILRDKDDYWATRRP